MVWSIEAADDQGGDVVLSGITTGSERVWRDAFWFNLRPDADTPRIDYFGDRVLWRSDVRAEEPL